MDLKKHFVNEDIVPFEVEGAKFGYKPTTAGEENSWTEEYLVYNQEAKKYKTDWGLVNKCKLKNLIDAPYTKEDINEVIGLELSWKELNHNQKWSLLEKLKPKIFTAIIKHVNRIDKGDDEIKKG